jgi:hypothetical protein
VRTVIYKMNSNNRRKKNEIRMKIAFFHSLVDQEDITYVFFVRRSFEKKNIMSVSDIDSLNLTDIRKRLDDTSGLLVRSFNSMDRSFESALSICLFETERRS